MQIFESAAICTRKFQGTCISCWFKYLHLSYKKFPNKILVCKISIIHTVFIFFVIKQQKHIYFHSKLKNKVIRQSLDLDCLWCAFNIFLHRIRWFSLRRNFIKYWHHITSNHSVIIIQKDINLNRIFCILFFTNILFLFYVNDYIKSEFIEFHMLLWRYIYTIERYIMLDI